MNGPLEREVKLRYSEPVEAREAILETGARLTRRRRLQQDCLLDTDDGTLKRQNLTLRVRVESEQATVTFKGPPIPSTMKLREELETPVGDGSTVLRMLERIGFTIAFRYEKYREEFRSGDVIVAIDETPIGTFVELEGSSQGIEALTVQLGRAQSDYITETYYELFMQTGNPETTASPHMIFGSVT